MSRAHSDHSDQDGLKGRIKRYLDQYASEHTRLSTKLTHFVGIPMIVVSIPVAFVSPLLGAGLFAGGWALQLAGHYLFEHNHPAFTHDPVYLLVGPVWVVIEVLQLLGLPLPDYLTPGTHNHVGEQPVSGPSPAAN